MSKVTKILLSLIMCITIISCTEQNTYDDIIEVGEIIIINLLDDYKNMPVNVVEKIYRIRFDQKPDIIKEFESYSVIYLKSEIEGDSSGMLTLDIFYDVVLFSNNEAHAYIFNLNYADLRVTYTKKELLDLRNWVIVWKLKENEDS